MSFGIKGAQNRFAVLPDCVESEARAKPKTPKKENQTNPKSQPHQQPKKRSQKNKKDKQQKVRSLMKKHFIYTSQLMLYLHVFNGTGPSEGMGFSAPPSDCLLHKDGGILKVPFPRTQQVNLRLFHYIIFCVQHQVEKL